MVNMGFYRGLGDIIVLVSLKRDGIQLERVVG